MVVDAKAGDFHLTPRSPCIDKGRAVTHAVGDGRDRDTIVVENAYCFSDGNGVIAGDTVQIGTGLSAQRARVITVLDEKRLKLDRTVFWRRGDGVTFPFRGAAPDIGAYESGGDRRIIGPTWQHYPVRRFD
jgi:hypothetical protein